MGGEFGQLSEWYCKPSLDWHLLTENPQHQRLQDYVARLNGMYRELRPLWEVDFSHEGFRWMDFNDVDNSIVAFARFGKTPADHVVCLLNFTPNVIHDYKVGVPGTLPYREIFNSDDPEFGGSNVTNPEQKVVFHEPFGQAPYHVLVSVPPLGGLILKPVD